MLQHPGIRMPRIHVIALTVYIIIGLYYSNYTLLHDDAYAAVRLFADNAEERYGQTARHARDNHGKVNVVGHQYRIR